MAGAQPLFGAAEEHVVVMLSGGRDSVCLLDLAVAELGAGRVTALHVNHGLRGEAAGDEEACLAECARQGVVLEVVRLGAPPAAGNLQAWARRERYAAAARVARDRRAVVAAGHTASDQAETVLYRLAASPGRRALLGMRPRRTLPVPGEAITLVRPLLSYTRAETSAHCVARGLSWRDDPSNDTSRYARGRVRTELLQALRGVHPAAERNVLRTAELLREEAEALDELVDASVEGDRVELARLRTLGPALRRLVLRRMAETAAGRPVPEVGRRADEIGALSPRGTARIDIGHGVQAVAEYGVVRFVIAAPLPDPPAAVELPVPGRASFGNWTVTCGEAPLERGDGVVDRAVLGDRPLLRPWQPGDRMDPIGAGGNKTLGDLFTARRVPVARRPSLPVLVVDGEIAWVPGVATGRRFALGEQTRAAVRLSAKETV
ncbi:MAG: tRNA lysidine(34) synthetase TilS [Solirubrobacteraceae bacterium]